MMNTVPAPVASEKATVGVVVLQVVFNVVAEPVETFDGPPYVGVSSARLPLLMTQLAAMVVDTVRGAADAPAQMPAMSATAVHSEASARAELAVFTK